MTAKRIRKEIMLLLFATFAFALAMPVCAAATDALLMGDANGDGRVTSADASFLARYVAQRIAGVPQPFAADDSSSLRKDVNCDGEVDLTDVVRLARWLVGHFDSLCPYGGCERCDPDYGTTQYFVQDFTWLEEIQHLVPEQYVFGAVLASSARSGNINSIDVSLVWHLWFFGSTMTQSSLRATPLSDRHPMVLLVDELIIMRDAGRLPANIVELLPQPGEPQGYILGATAGCLIQPRFQRCFRECAASLHCIIGNLVIGDLVLTGTIVNEAHPLSQEGMRTRDHNILRSSAHPNGNRMMKLVDELNNELRSAGLSYTFNAFSMASSTRGAFAPNSDAANMQLVLEYEESNLVPGGYAVITTRISENADGINAMDYVLSVDNMEITRTNGIFPYEHIDTGAMGSRYFVMLTSNAEPHMQDGIISKFKISIPYDSNLIGTTHTVNLDVGAFANGKWKQWLNLLNNTVSFTVQVAQSEDIHELEKLL